jgi:diaminopimelate decarboxylase
VLELGRYLIGEAGYYLMRVLNIKKSRGSLMCICDGGMHHHLAASGHLGSVIPRNYRMFKVDSHDGAEREIVSYEMCGPLCTSIDRLGRDVKLPALKAGDVIAVECSGAYGITASPMHFISHELPKEILLETIAGQLTMKDASDRLS